MIASKKCIISDKKSGISNDIIFFVKMYLFTVTPLWSDLNQPKSDVQLCFNFLTKARVPKLYNGIQQLYITAIWKLGKIAF